ncbi:unnamed protein product [Chironomus riparius]|uniref:NACHT domain-containing protein n=1 Tax=Chironomus riparius TaxID=315576 RepID=A0A9N9WVT2_9DIPT|nr:unnamed protein product [Chironomus riparius]
MSSSLFKQNSARDGFLRRRILSVDSQVTSEWDKLSRRDKIRILDSNFDFQGKTMKFNSFNNLYPELIKTLTFDQLKSVLYKQKLVIGRKIENHTDYYVDRRFLHEDAKLICFEFQFGHEFIQTYDDPYEHQDSRTAGRTFKEFYEEFFKLSFKERSQIFTKVRKNEFYQSCNYDLNEDIFHFLNVSSNEMIKQAERDKVLVLSSDTGLGKTTALKHIAVEFKNKFPTKWVSYIDLKIFTNLFKSDPNADKVEELLMKILDLNLERNSFEVEVFRESFKSGNVVLFWDDFGEISSDYVLKFLKFIRENSSNIQFVSTDISYSDQFDVRTLLLNPFDQNEKQEFLRKFLMSENPLDVSIDEKVKNINDFIKKFDFHNESSSEFNSPTILKLIVSYRDIAFPLKYDNIYKIYEYIIDSKIEFWIHQNENLLNGKSKSTVRDLLKRILQKYALISQIHAFKISTSFSKLLKLQIMQIELPEDFPLKEISQMKLFNDKNIFYHSTFSQFFVAQYFIENIFNVDDLVDSDEAEIRLEIFHHMVHIYGDHDRIITDFMSSYLLTRDKNKDKNFNSLISTLLRTKFKNFFIRILDTNYSDVFKFLFEFFKKDHDLVVDLLHVNEVETFYTAIFNPNHFALFTNPDEIKVLAKNCLTDEEFDKFVTGKNQKGVILSGIYFYNLLNISKVNDGYNVELQTFNNGNYSFWEFLNKIKESLTLNEYRQLLTALLSPKLYLFYDKLFSDSVFSDYKNLWSTVESLSTKSQISEILGNTLHNILEVIPQNKNDYGQYSSFLLDKAEKLLSKSEIYEMFLNKNILHEAVWADFEGLWNYFENQTTNEQQRSILLKNDFDDKNFYFYRSYLEEKANLSSSMYQYYPYDFTPYNIFHRSLVRPSAPTYDITKQIYDNHFNKAEMQEMILSSNHFIIVLITMTDKEPCERFVEYLEKLFEENENLLKKYLEEKIKPTNLSLLEYVKKLTNYTDFLDQLINLKSFTNLYEKL